LKAQTGEGDLEGVTSGSGEGQEIGAAERVRNSEPAAGSSKPPEAGEGVGGDGVEAALASALSAAAAAGRFDVVAQLAREIEAQRLARAGRAGNVNTIETARRR
jgi:hypothetical protein